MSIFFIAGLWLKHGIHILVFNVQLKKVVQKRRRRDLSITYTNKRRCYLVPRSAQWQGIYFEPISAKYVTSMSFDEYNSEFWLACSLTSTTGSFASIAWLIIICQLEVPIRKWKVGCPWAAHAVHGLSTEAMGSSVGRSCPLLMKTHYNICPWAAHGQLSGQELPINFQSFYNIWPWAAHGQLRLLDYIVGSSNLNAEKEVGNSNIGFHHASE